jgi:hypothetical protein
VESKVGKRTGEFGQWLTQSLEKDSQYSVYYDHGDKQRNSNVASIKGFYGHEITDEVSNKNRLADIDVIVVNNDNNEALLLIEIEEGEMQPKKLLGDVLAILMCNRLAVRIKNKQRYFGISSKTQLIIAGLVSNRGNGQDKIRNIITPRLRQFDVPGDTVQVDKIKFVLGGNISETIEKLENEMKNIFSKEKDEK